MKPILQDQPISYIFDRPQYFRNAAREKSWGTPVYFVPPQFTKDQYGNYGPKGQRNYNYFNSPSKYLGNCTFWCYGRNLELTGTRLEELMKPLDWTAKKWFDNFNGPKSTNADDIVAGDILVLSDSGDGHVMTCELVDGAVHFSHSAYSKRALWKNSDGQSYACRVCTYKKSELVQGKTINIYRDYGEVANEVVIGVIHTGLREDKSVKELKAEVKALNDKLAKIKEICEKNKGEFIWRT